MVLGNECLYISGKVIYHHQHIPYHGLFVHCYCDLHSDIIDVDQFHQLSADNRLHGWELALCLVLNTSPTVSYDLQQGLGHTRPPKLFFHQAQSAVMALMSSTTVATIYGSLPVHSQDYEDRCHILAIGGGDLKVQQIILQGKFLLLDGIEVSLIVRGYSG